MILKLSDLKETDLEDLLTGKKSPKEMAIAKALPGLKTIGKKLQFGQSNPKGEK